MFFPWPGLPLTRVHMCHIVRGKYVPVAGARNTLPVASKDGTGSRKAAEMVLRRIQLKVSSFFTCSFPRSVFFTRHPFAFSPAVWTGPMLTAGYFTVGAEGQVAGWLRFSTAALSHYMGQWSSNSSPLLTNQKHAAPNTGLCPSKRGLGGVGGGGGAWQDGGEVQWQTQRGGNPVRVIG